MPSPLETRWNNALQYFRSRGQVIFANESVRFWEKHGFVQQSLAKLLTQYEIPVTWYDDFGWRAYDPVVRWDSKFLKVGSLRRVPGDRFSVVRQLNDTWVANRLGQQMKGSGKKAVFWVQASLSESVARRLPWIDVFSVFDDPYRHIPEDSLITKAKLVTCQNAFAFKRLEKKIGSKLIELYPPFRVSKESYSGEEELSLPAYFPKKVMGYIGSFTGDATDFGLMESLLIRAPDWGLLLAGRTDAVGKPWLERLKSYPNFLHFDWLPPEKLAGLWKKVDVTILPYRQGWMNDGAFPVKILESFYFGVPVVATCVPKTSSLEGTVPRENFPDLFLAACEREREKGKERCKRLFEQFSLEMSPELHLIRVAEHLQSHV